MLKSYAPDLDYVERLVTSFNRLNVEEHALYIVVPGSDVESFRQFGSRTISVLADEDVTSDFLGEAESKLVPLVGAANAGVVKLAFGMTGIADTYLALDSDMEFVSPIRMSNFFDEQGLPYLVARDYPELRSDPFYRSRYWEERVRQYEIALNVLGTSDARGRNCHNTQIMSRNVIESLNSRLLDRGLTFSRAMSLSPMEFFWYGAWALNTPQYQATIISDLALMVQHQGHHLALRLNGVTKVSLGEAFLGVIVNSNWSRQYGLVDFDEPPIEKYLRQGVWGEWLRQEMPDSLLHSLHLRGESG